MPGVRCPTQRSAVFVPFRVGAMHAFPQFCARATRLRTKGPPAPSRVKRILVLGNAGSGKSTLARELARVLAVPVIHLDALFWQPGWRETPRDEWKRRVGGLLSNEGWVMDGNYLGTLPERLAAADTAVLLDVSRVRCLYRVVRRGFMERGKPRADLAAGCVEQIPDMRFLQWIWRFPRDDMRPMLEQLQRAAASKHIKVLRSAAEVRAFLNELDNENSGAIATSAASI
jgi:adenylate kinase family enzyme